VHHDSHHHHHHGGAGAGRALKWSLVATIAFVVLEAISGIEAHSLALLSDAGHNFTDALAIALAVLGLYLQAKPADQSRTYGYHRAGVLAAFVNALTLLLLAGWIFWESYQRLLQPEPVAERVMMWVAAFGLLLNAGVMWSLRKSSGHDINVRAVFVHMLGDALSSAAIIAGAVVIAFTGWAWIDPVLSIVIGVLIVWTTWDIIRDSLNILLEGLPRGLTLADVTGAMRSVVGVVEVHDLHIWSLGSSTHAMSCHVVIADIPPSESTSILERLKAVLDQRFGIQHTTIQFEHERCAMPGNGCVMPVSSQHTH
jgi:cobalt-zinc-cadmium efflux system protein